jgi:hypothetical protein
MPTYDEAYIDRAIEVQNANNARLLAIPGVRLVALACKEIDGVSTGQLAIRVHVVRKRAAASVPAEELIPATIDGIPVDVIDPARAANVVAVSALPLVPGAIMDSSVFTFASLRSEVRRPLVGGVQLMPSAFIRPEFPNKGARAPGGTLGTVLWDRDNHQRGFAVTCQHVIDADGQAFVERGETDVGSPDTSTKSTCCGTDNMIGVYLDGEHPGRESDEAVVTLREGMRWQPHVIEIGRIPVHPPVTRPALVQLMTAKAQVRKRGARTGLTGGVITAINGTDGTSFFSVLIRPNDNREARPGDRLVFADRGDSGAALVDDDKRVLGIVTTRDKSGGEGGGSQPEADGIERVPARALPMSRVLEKLHALFASRTPPINLHLEVAMSERDDEVFTVPGGSSIAVPAELARVVDTDTFLGGRDADGVVRAPVGRAWFTADEPTPHRLAAIRRALAPTVVGGRLDAFWEKHQRELLALINNDRRVTLVWHRGGGAAVFQALIRMMSQPGLAMPETISGTPVATCVDRFAGTLIERGSPGFAEDLRQLRAVLPDIGGRTVPEMLVAFGAEPIDLTADALAAGRG